MSCDICGRRNCSRVFHSIAEQNKYEKVTEAFDKARELREQVRSEPDDDENTWPGNDKNEHPESP